MDYYLKLRELHPDDQASMDAVKKRILRIDNRFGSNAEDSAELHGQLYDAALLTIEHLLDDLESAAETIRLQNLEIEWLKR